jgi:signal transduction protein with GAF and PtsI domain
MLQNQEIGQRGASGSLRVVYSVQKPAVVSALNSSIGPLLELCLSQTGSQGAYVYRLSASASLLELVVWRGARPTDIPSYSVELSGKAASWVREAGAYIALEKGAWQDWRFASLPEFLYNRYESTVSVPLIEEGKLNGIVNVCGRLPTRYDAGEGVFLAGLSLPIGGILANARLESVQLDGRGRVSPSAPHQPPDPHSDAECCATRNSELRPSR